MNGYDLVRPLLFKLRPETAHWFTTSVMRAALRGPVRRAVDERYSVEDPRLATDLFGLSFPNPVGLAAGFDKNGTMYNELASLGFGFVEIGGVTAEKQPGNAKPRLFRLEGDRALINRMGFNNRGADEVRAILADQAPADVPLGVNIGLSESAALEAAAEDYAYTYERLAEYGDYFVVNVSCPNRSGLRNLQQSEELERIIDSLQALGAEPLLVKLSPDVHTAELEGMIETMRRADVDGVVATNTSSARPADLEDDNSGQAGGLSGKPIERDANETIEFIAERTDIPIVGVGGVSTAADAYRKIRLGASVVQLYTGLIYEGPSIARDINRGLLRLLEEDGFATVSEAVGVDVGDGPVDVDEDPAPDREREQPATV